MAEQSTQDVVNQNQSAGDLSPSDAPATTSTPDIKVSGDVTGVAEAAPKENGIHTLPNLKMDDLDEGSVRSDTDTSRAGSVTDDKVAEQRPLKKFAAKPVSFAKYSVPKVIAASAAAKGTDKGNMGTLLVPICLTGLGSSCDHRFLRVHAWPGWSPKTSRENYKLSSVEGESIQECYTRPDAGLE